MQNPSQHCPWLHNVSKRQFPNKPVMFSHGSQERFCYCLGCLLQVSGFHHTCTNLTPEKNTCIYWIGGRVGQTASLLWKREKYHAPTRIHNTDRPSKSYSLISYAIPGPTAISKYLSISCMNCQSHCIMTVTKSHWKWTWTTTCPHTVNHNQVTL